MFAANQHCLGQALAMVATLTDEQYARPRGEWSSVGAQYRHVVEHYLCLLEGLPAGRIDYDARRRDREVELSRARALEVTQAVAERLEAINGWPTDHPLTVQMQCDPDENACWAESTLGRELQFLVSHSVHHFALIKLLLAGDPVALDDGFGTAPSTLSHLRAPR